MGKQNGGRFGRLFGGDTEPDAGDETVALSGNDDHAWWADRRSLSGAPTGAPAAGRDDDRPDGDEPEYEKWSAEALFADAGFDPTFPPPEPEQDDGTTTLLIDSDLDEARLVLGVGLGATWKAVTKAHRTLAMQFHPDRLIAQSPAAQELGQQRMAEINRAYDMLRDHHHA